MKNFNLGVLIKKLQFPPFVSRLLVSAQKKFFDIQPLDQKKILQLMTKLLKRILSKQPIIIIDCNVVIYCNLKSHYNYRENLLKIPSLSLQKLKQSFLHFVD